MSHILIKRTSTPSKVPTTADLILGELALNTYDGKLFMRKDDGTATIIELGAGASEFTGDVIGTAVNGSVALSLSNTGVAAGTYTKVSVDAKGRVVNGGPLVSTDVTNALGFTPADAATRGAANGLATLDATGRLPASQLTAAVVGSVVYQGTWNAGTNTPTLTSSVGTKGHYYKVSVAGNTNLNGLDSWNVGDVVIFDGTTWDKLDGTAYEVLSVAGRTGVITLTMADINGDVDGGVY